jgi:hypothetical protein
VRFKVRGIASTKHPMHSRGLAHRGRAGVETGELLGEVLDGRGVNAADEDVFGRPVANRHLVRVATGRHHHALNVEVIGAVVS